MIKTIAILGCGWLGLPLAKALLEAGYRVHGSTTSQEKIPLLTKAGLQPFMIRLGEDEIAGPVTEFLSGADLLIVNVPPGIRGGSRESYLRKMQQLHRALAESKVQKVVFVSSTSVYGSREGEVTEETPPAPDTASGSQLLEAEQIFSRDPRLASITVRFGGLIGPGRHPVTFLAGRKGLRNGHEAVNLIHLDDCVALLINVITGGYWNEIFNGVSPEHPKKIAYYTHEAGKKGLQPPEYSKTGGSSKVVSSQKYLSRGHVFLTSIYS